jgi:predicted metal-dependent enzyme (double-stranded beta helix superfamily)
MPVRKGRSPRTSASTENDSVVGDSIAARAMSASSASIQPIRRHAKACLNGARGRISINQIDKLVFSRDTAFVHLVAPSPLPARLLEAIAIDRAVTARITDIPTPGSGERTYRRVQRTESYDVWIIRWGPESRAELHDHAGSAGALCVVAGELVESQPNPAGYGRRLRRALRLLEHRAMAPSHVHEVANETDAIAVSVHVYSPPLEEVRRYAVGADSALRVVHRDSVVSSGAARLSA